MNKTKLNIVAAIVLVVVLVVISILKVSLSEKEEPAVVRPDSTLNQIKPQPVVIPVAIDSSKIYADSLRSLLVYYETAIESLKQEKAVLAERKVDSTKAKVDSSQSDVDSLKLKELTEKYVTAADSIKNLLEVKMTHRDSVRVQLLADYDSLLNMIPDSLHPMDRAEAMKSVVVDLSKKYRIRLNTVQSYIKNRK